MWRPATCAYSQQSPARGAAFGDWHGGTIEEAAKLLQDGVKSSTASKLTLPLTAEQIAKKYRERREKLRGYGHITHTSDPRTRRLLEIAEQSKILGPHIELAVDIEPLTDKIFGRRLILNVDRCIAAIISDMGFDSRIGKGFFIVSRVPGLVAHAYEQLYFDKPYKVADWKEVVYTSPPERKTPGQMSAH